MSEQNLALATQLLEKMGRQAPLEEFEAFVSDDLVFEVAGDASILPWIGPPTAGRQAFMDFIRDQRDLLNAESFHVDDILHNQTKVVILGELSANVKRTRKTLQTYFALILIISENKIVRFQMVEDSYAVSRAAR